VLVPSDATRGELLYERVAPVVQRMAWIYLATDPERDDITQDILLSVLQGASSVKDPARLEAWAARVAFNTICNVFRRRKILRWLSLEALSGYEPPAPQADLEGRELVARAQKILERLPTSERMPFTLQLFGNASTAEIAKVCDCSERTLRRRLSAARERFTRLVKLDPVLASRLAEPVVPEQETSDG
jgi:RNA polymerase sigma factor (sigma-70 family)